MVNCLTKEGAKYMHKGVGRQTAREANSYLGSLDHVIKQHSTTYTTWHHHPHQTCRDTCINLEEIPLKNVCHYQFNTSGDILWEHRCHPLYFEFGSLECPRQWKGTVDAKDFCHSHTLTYYLFCFHLCLYICFFVYVSAIWITDIGVSKVCTVLSALPDTDAKNYFTDQASYSFVTSQ